MRRHAAIWIPALLAVCLCIGATFAAWSWAAHDARMVELSERGAVTAGTVVGITMAAGVSPAKFEMQRPARYYVTYRFIDARGIERQAMSNGTGLHYSALAVGDGIAVRYLPDDPDLNIYDRGGPTLSTSPINVIVLMLAGAALLGGYAVSAFRKSRVGSAPRRV